MTHTNTGEKTKQESVWTGPLDVKRVSTDVPFIIGFGVFILFWIAISIYGFCAGDSERFLHPHNMHHMQLYFIIRQVHENIGEAKYIILGFFAWSGLLLFIIGILLRWVTKAFVIITIILTSVMLVILHCLIIYATYLNVLELNVFLFVAVITVLYGFIIYALIKTGIKIVCKVIKESCKAMFFFPSTLIFAVIQFSLQLLIAVFALSVYTYFLSIRIPKNINNTSYEQMDMYRYLFFYINTVVPPHIYLFHVVNFCGYVWATWFVMGLGRMVLTATFVTWYQAKDKNSIPMMIIPKCFMVIIRYHTGTLAYASSPLSIIPLFYVTWKHGLEKLKKMYKQPILILTWFTILLKFSFDAVTMCAVHGNTFYKSAKESYILIMKHPVSYLVTNTVCEYVIVLCTLLLPTLSFFSANTYCIFVTPALSMDIRNTAILVVTITSLIMSLTFFVVFRSASNTTRYCYLEDSKFNNEAEMKLYEIHLDDESIYDVHQDPNCHP